MNPNFNTLLYNLFDLMDADNADEDKNTDEFSKKVNEFLTIKGCDKWSDWLDFDGMFKLVAENFIPGKGINRIPVDIAQYDNDDIVSVLSTYIVGYSQDDYTVEIIDDRVWHSRVSDCRFRVGIPKKKTVRDVPFDTTIKSVKLSDGTTYSNVTRVKGGVLSIVDGEITIHDLDDVKDFTL